MSTVTKLLAWLRRIGVKAERERREAYLASSANLFELEQRVRLLDRVDTSAMRGL
jgi:hypothetical protein